MASQLAFQAAKDAGIVSFAASGNRGSCGPNGEMGYPPCVSAVVGVGSVHDADLGREPDAGTECENCAMKFSSGCCNSGCADCFSETTAPGQPACWMDRTPCTEMIAPGHLIVAPDGDDGASEGSGTSFASPHAAAVAALLAGRCLSPDEIIDVMTRSGTVVSNGCSVDDRPTVVINAFAAVELAETEFPLCSLEFGHSI